VTERHCNCAAFFIAISYLCASAQQKIIYSSEENAFGANLSRGCTWALHHNGADLKEIASGGRDGGKCMEFSYNFLDAGAEHYWDGCGMNVTCWGSYGSPVNTTGFAKLSLWYKGLSAGHTLSVKLATAPGEGAYTNPVECGGPATQWTNAQIPLAQFTGGTYTPSQLVEIAFDVTQDGAHMVAASVLLDDIVLTSGGAVAVIDRQGALPDGGAAVHVAPRDGRMTMTILDTRGRVVGSSWRFVQAGESIDAARFSPQHDGRGVYIVNLNGAGIQMSQMLHR